MIASSKIGILKSQLYGAKSTEIIENIHMKLIDKIFALNGIAPVFRNSPTWLPNRRLLITKKYSRSDDLTKSIAEIINQIVPGKPGITYPTIPKPRHISPTETNIALLHLLRILRTRINRFSFLALTSTINPNTSIRNARHYNLFKGHDILQSTKILD